MKKTIASILALVTLFSLSACGGGTTGTGGTSSSGDQPQPQAVLKVASGDSVGSYEYQFMMKFVEELKSRAPGYFQIETYDSGSVGSDREMMTSLKMGTLQAVCVIDGAVSMVDSLPASEIGNVPFLIESPEDFYRLLLESDFGTWLKEEYHKLGYTVGGYYIFGSVEIGNQIRELKTPADLENMKIRIWQADGPYLLLSAANALPTVMDYGEVRTALQQKAIDGIITTDANFVSEKFDEIVKYVTSLNISENYRTLLFSNTWLDALPDDIQTAVLESAEAAESWFRAELSPQSKREVVDALKSHGVTITEYTAEERQAFVEIGESTWDTFRDTIGAEPFDMAVEFLRGT